LVFIFINRPQRGSKSNELHREPAGKAHCRENCDAWVSTRRRHRVAARRSISGGGETDRSNPTSINVISFGTVGLKPITQRTFFIKLKADKPTPVERLRYAYVFPARRRRIRKANTIHRLRGAYLAIFDRLMRVIMTLPRAPGAAKVRLNEHNKNSRAGALGLYHFA
jgi:hypothetical protein